MKLKPGMYTFTIIGYTSIDNGTPLTLQVRNENDGSSVGTWRVVVDSAEVDTIRSRKKIMFYFRYEKDLYYAEFLPRTHKGSLLTVNGRSLL